MKAIVKEGSRLSTDYYVVTMGDNCVLGLKGFSRYYTLSLKDAYCEP